MTTGAGDRGFRPTKAQPTKARKGRPWLGLLGTVVVLAGAVGLLLLFRGGGGNGGGGSPAIGDHIHAAYGVNLCGLFLPNPPEFVSQAGTDDNYAGLHTHGDGLIHIEPTSEVDTGDNATLGRYFEYGGGEVTENSVTNLDGREFNAGQPCPDGRRAELRWSVNGEEQQGNPADYKLEDGDVIVVGILPAGDDLGTPPSEPNLENPTAGERPPPGQ